MTYNIHLTFTKQHSELVTSTQHCSQLQRARAIINVLYIPTAFIPCLYSRICEGLGVNMAVKSFIVPINVKMSLRKALRLCLNHLRSAWSHSAWESERRTRSRNPRLSSTPLLGHKVPSVWWIRRGSHCVSWRTPASDTERALSQPRVARGN